MLAVALLYAVFFYVAANKMYELSNSYAALERTNAAFLRPRMRATYWSALLGGRRADASDVQWRDFRGNLPTLAGVAAAYLAASAAARRAGRMPHVSFLVGAGLSYLVYLHGTYAAVLLAFALGNFFLSRVAARSGAGPLLLWAWNLGALFGVDGAGTTWPDWLGGGPLGVRMHARGGVLRWHLPLNLLVLRTISFGVDRWWAARAAQAGGGSGGGSGGGGGRRDAPATGSVDARAAEPRAPAEYDSLALYLAYLFYPPLYFSGPTCSFNAFASYVAAPQTAVRGGELAAYALRVVVAVAIKDLFCTMFYVDGVSDNMYRAVYDAGRRPALLIDAVTDYGRGFDGMAFFPYFRLTGVWLKFLVIWRFARCWALLDGVDTHENMERCISSQYSIAGFWRAWHRSFNRWLVRYVYVPLGGDGGGDGGAGEAAALPWRRAVNTAVVFLFVAAWHDRSLQLLAWAWLAILFALPEMAAHRWYSGSRMRARRLARPLLWHHAEAAGGAANVVMLMAANLVGFGPGLDGARAMLRVVTASPGSLAWAAFLFVCIYVNVLAVLELRRRQALVKAD